MRCWQVIRSIGHVSVPYEAGDEVTHREDGRTGIIVSVWEPTVCDQGPDVRGRPTEHPDLNPHVQYWAGVDRRRLGRRLDHRPPRSINPLRTGRQRMRKVIAVTIAALALCVPAAAQAKIGHCGNDGPARGIMAINVKPARDVVRGGYLTPCSVAFYVEAAGVDWYQSPSQVGFRPFRLRVDLGPANPETWSYRLVYDEFPASGPSRIDFTARDGWQTVKWSYR